MEIRKDAEPHHQQQREAHIHKDLARVEALRRKFGLDWIFMNGARRAAFRKNAMCAAIKRKIAAGIRNRCAT